jgi:hypothetical protein
MLSGSAEQKTYLEDVTRGIVSDVAPEELDLFDELLDEYYADPNPPDLEAQAVDEALAFGLPEVMVAVTPAAAAMVQAVVNFLLSEVAKSLKEESLEALKEGSSTALKDLIQGLFKRDDAKEKDGPEPLSQEQLKKVKQIARRKAKEFGLDPDTAKKMSEALIGSLVLAT